MEYYNKEFCIEVWGDYACFTRPEMKVERVSYDFITPSSARAVFEAIFWKPAIRWKVTRIEVLNPIKWISVRRNEIGNTMSPRSKEIFIEDYRQQKAGLFLKDVHYRLYAELEFIKPENRINSNDRSQDSSVESNEQNISGQDENPGKYYAIFERRARKGQCFNQPYLGCREFSASFSLVEKPGGSEKQPIQQSMDPGFMLYDMDFTNKEDPRPMFFRPKMENGVIVVPPVESPEVRK